MNIEDDDDDNDASTADLSAAIDVACSKYVEKGKSLSPELLAKVNKKSYQWYQTISSDGIFFVKSI